jgi:hypothetical protein
MFGPHYDVHDDYGRVIGWVQRGTIEGVEGEVWRALSLDGCDLGAHADRGEASWLIRDDWDAGRPRDPDEPRQRFRPIHARRVGATPLYLGR